MKLVWAAVALCAGAGSVQAQTTERVSVDSAGAQAPQASYVSPGAISGDGRFVVFDSSASSLVAGDTNNRTDVFVRDRQTGTTERVSLDSAGQQGNDSSFWPAISADGRFVAFSSIASNLVAGDTNNTSDVFVHDRQTGTTVRVSVNPAGVEGNDYSAQPSISADGSCVAFWSRASNLVTGDLNARPDFFVRDRLNGTTELVSVGPNGWQANNDIGTAMISGDGLYVVFGSKAVTLVLGDTNQVWDVFVRNRVLGTTERVSVDSSGGQGDGVSFGGDYQTCPAISFDGRFVAFTSRATNLVAGDTNGVGDVFVHDRQTDVTERVSVDSTGGQVAGQSLASAISADGRYVVFASDATNLVASDTNGYRDLFVHDRLSGTTELVSVDGAGLQGDSNSWVPSLSADGRFVAFWSWTTNLVPGDTNGYPDVFLRDRRAPGVVSFCTPGQAEAIGCPCANPPAGAGRGCDNSSATGGAALSASGNASLAADTLVFGTAAETPTATSIVVQGTSFSFSGVVFGQGVRCVSGALKRMYVHTAAGGSIQAPSGSDPSVSARSAALGDAIAAGEHRFYMVQYRDPFVLGGCAATSTFNATNAVDVPWSP